MGNKPSSPLVQQIQNLAARATPPPPPPPPDPRVERERIRVQLNMAKNDAAAKQKEYDQLVPDEAQKRKIKEADDAMKVYLDPKVQQFDYEMKLFNQALNQVDTLANNGAFILAQKYRKDLEQKHKSVADTYMKNKETVFTNRRRFLDADPQEGVPGFSWFQSIDDQIMAAFWICYSLFIGVLISYVITYFREKIGSARNLVVVSTVVFGVCIGIAHTFIKLYG